MVPRSDWVIDYSKWAMKRSSFFSIWILRWIIKDRLVEIVVKLLKNRFFGNGRFNGSFWWVLVVGTLAKKQRLVASRPPWGYFRAGSYFLIKSRASHPRLAANSWADSLSQRRQLGLTASIQLVYPFIRRCQGISFEVGFFHCTHPLDCWFVWLVSSDRTLDVLCHSL